jgi:hypothetical protein
MYCNRIRYYVNHFRPTRNSYGHLTFWRGFELFYQSGRVYAASRINKVDPLTGVRPHALPICTLPEYLGGDLDEILGLCPA